MTSTDQALAGARRLGRSAAIARTGLKACPYPADGTPTERAARSAWHATYLGWRPFDRPPVDLQDPLTAIAHGPDAGDDGTPATAGLNLYPAAGR